MKKVFIVASSHEYAEMFKALGFAITTSRETADLVCFTGGADVTPKLYGDACHPYTHYEKARDADEMEEYEFCITNNIPMIGICRGAQFLNVMSGGRMYQHVDKHTRSHEITDLQTGQTLYVSSTHHQMMMPSPKGLLVASSALGGSREWYDGEVFKKDISKEDIEVVYYAHTKCLCFQPHPEFDGYDDMRDYFNNLLCVYLGV
jgi:GMP synthase-like glutamine amidotransferase